MFETPETCSSVIIRIGGGRSFEPISVNIDTLVPCKCKDEAYGVQVEIERQLDDELKKLEERLG